MVMRMQGFFLGATGLEKPNRKEKAIIYCERGNTTLVVHCLR
jgi:hypothetical protein